MTIKRRDLRNFVCRSALALACLILFAAVVFNTNLVRPVQEKLASALSLSADARPLGDILRAAASNENLDIAVVVAVLIGISLFGKRRSPPKKL